MENKLKTLKDSHKEVWDKLKLAVSPLEREFLRGRLVQLDNDRQEAIKWIKTYQSLEPGCCQFECAEKFNKLAKADLLDGEYCHTWIDALFGHFFNITEKELQEGEN